MAARGRNKSRQPRNEGERLHLDGSGAVRPRLLEVQLHVPIVQDLQPVVGEGRAQDIAAQGQSAGLVVGGDTASAMQVEAVVLGAQGALGDGAVVGVEHNAEGRRARRSRVGQGLGG